MRKPIIAFLAGAPGAGKTTLARRAGQYIQVSFGVDVVHIEVDDVRWMVISDESENNAFPKWSALVESLLDRAVTLSEVILVEGLFYHPLTLERLIGRYPGGQAFLVEASLETCLARNNTRSISSERLPNFEVKKVYTAMQRLSAIRLDGEKPVEDVVMDLVRFLNIQPSP